MISTGINSTSQLNTIKKFIKQNEIKKTIFLIPNLNYDLEIKKELKNQNLKHQNNIFMILSLLN